jgi:hypothetical protein
MKESKPKIVMGTQGKAWTFDGSSECCLKIMIEINQGLDDNTQDNVQDVFTDMIARLDKLMENSP